jgi:predicted O-linked N-acetylglucosamine transferase (SPINDLY family)
MKNTSDLFRQIIPNINYVSKNIDEQKKQKRIRVGFISGFLTKHTVGKLFGGLIKNIDRKKFDIIIFHTHRTKKSLMKNEIDSRSNKIINLSNRIKEQHEQVEKENLDIIFYPEIGMSSITYFLAFARLAPVQIVSWGHPETTGINTIDYFLSSTLLEPNNVRRKYSERLICLSQFPLYYEPPQNLGTLKNRKDLKLPENIRLYGCPQSLFKLHPDFDSILAEILDQDPEGRIILIGGEGKKKYWLEILKKRWSKNFPILNKKVLFTNTLSLLEFISLCKCVNVLLDPIHFGGGNSFLETMLVGTPSITMPGTHLKTNIIAAAYKQMKISKPPIVQSSKEYINLVIELAQDDKKNLSLREESKTAANKYLYNNLKALKEFEQFLEEAHTTAQSGNKLKDSHIIKF